MSMSSLLNNKSHHEKNLAKFYARQKPNIYFNPISAHQLLHNEPPTLGYARSYQVQDCALLYKIFKGDTKLLRSLLEAHDFTHTESHEWNILWSSGTCKQYLYEGLNEY
jgi:hypothetical protein